MSHHCEILKEVCSYSLTLGSCQNIRDPLCLDQECLDSRLCNRPLQICFNILYTSNNLCLQRCLPSYYKTISPARDRSFKASLYTICLSVTPGTLAMKILQMLDLNSSKVNKMSSISCQVDISRIF